MRKRIGFSDKAFRTLGKNYPEPYYALNELAVNAFFAPGVKNIDIHFDGNDGVYNSLWFHNDGKSLNREEIIRIIGELGCESANTPGNENGNGIKSCGSYFMDSEYKDSFLFFGSKTNNEINGIILLTPNGECTDELDSLSSAQRKFIEDRMTSFLDGCVTGIFHSRHLSDDEITMFRNGINNMFTTMLNTVNVKVFVGNNFYTYNKYADRLYRNIDLGDKRVKENNVTFSYRDKIYKCSYEIMTVGTKYEYINKDDLNYIDELFDYQDNTGIHLGYDNGFFPVSERKTALEILGLKTKESCYGVRGNIVAHPVEDDARYAGVDDWKMFISRLAHVNAQKVPDLKTPITYTRKKKNENTSIVVDEYKSFYSSVIEPMKAFINKLLGETDKPKNNSEDEGEFSDKMLEENNRVLSKQLLKWMDKNWNFAFEVFDDEDKVIRFAKHEDERCVLFNFFAESPLVKTIIQGGRNGRNGHNDLCKAVQPYVDTFKMMIQKCGTSSETDTTVKKMVKSYNDYYCS